MINFHEQPACPTHRINSNLHMFTALYHSHKKEMTMLISLYHTFIFTSPGPKKLLAYPLLGSIFMGCLVVGVSNICMVRMAHSVGTASALRILQKGYEPFLYGHLLTQKAEGEVQSWLRSERRRISLKYYALVKLFCPIPPGAAPGSEEKCGW